MSDMLPDFTTTLKYTLGAASTIFISLLGLLYFFQNKIIYASSFPEGSRQKVQTPNQVGLNDWEDVRLKAKDGIGIRAYAIYAPPLKARATVLYLHANAGNMGHRLPLARMFVHQIECNVVMLSYRGYGLSEGVANEVGIKLDSQAAIEYIQSNERLKNLPIILYGQSIGGAVAIYLAHRYYKDKIISALIVENTLLSIRKLIPHVMPFLKSVAFLCHQLWDSESALGYLSRDQEDMIPILFLAGAKDELVPPTHMKALYDIVKGHSNVRYCEFEHGTHNDTCIQSGYWDAVDEFIDELIKKKH